VVVLPNRLRASFVEFVDVVEYQIAEEEERLVVRVVLRNGGATDTPDRVAVAIRNALVEAGAAAPPIEVAVVGGLEREPGGKLKLVKSAPRSSG
jgi:hypothetical protein